MQFKNRSGLRGTCTVRTGLLAVVVVMVAGWSCQAQGLSPVSKLLPDATWKALQNKAKERLRIHAGEDRYIRDGEIVSLDGYDNLLDGEIVIENGTLFADSSLLKGLGKITVRPKGTAQARIVICNAEIGVGEIDIAPGGELIVANEIGHDESSIVKHPFKTDVIRNRGLIAGRGLLTASELIMGKNSELMVLAEDNLGLPGLKNLTPTPTLMTLTGSLTATTGTLTITVNATSYGRFSSSLPITINGAKLKVITLVAPAAGTVLRIVKGSVIYCSNNGNLGFSTPFIFDPVGMTYSADRVSPNAPLDFDCESSTKDCYKIKKD